MPHGKKLVEISRIEISGIEIEGGEVAHLLTVEVLAKKAQELVDAQAGSSPPDLKADKLKKLYKGLRNCLAKDFSGDKIINNKLMGLGRVDPIPP